MDFSGFVTGEDPGGWSYTASNTNLTISDQGGGSVRLSFITAGTTDITVKASNAAGSAAQTFRVTITN